MFDVAARAGSASSCRFSAAASAARPTRSSSPSPPPWPARPRRPLRLADLGPRRVPHGAPLRRARRHARSGSAATARSWPSNATPTSTWAPTRTSVRASFRRAPTPPPAPTASPTCGSTPRRLHEHDAGRRLPRLRRAAARVGARVAVRRGGGRLDRDPVDLRRQNLLAHGEEFAPGDTPIDGKFEESLRAPRRRSAGRGRCRGRPGPRRGHDDQGAASRRSSRRRSCGCTPTASVDRAGEHRRDGAGRAHGDRPDRRRGAGVPLDARDRRCGPTPR